MAQQRGSRRSVFRTTILYRSGPVGLFGLLKRRRLAYENCSRMIRPKLAITLRRKGRRNNSYTVVLNPDSVLSGWIRRTARVPRRAPFNRSHLGPFQVIRLACLISVTAALTTCKNDSRARQNDDGEKSLWLHSPGLLQR